LPNRNVIRWYAVNEFLGKVLGRKMKFHFTPELKSGEDKISGRLIRQKIKENNMVIPKEVIKLLPPTTLSILEDEIFKGHNTGQRNLEILKERSNKFSRSSLLEIAHINAGAVEEIINGRRYNRETQIWASFRKAGYGPVLTRLALSCLEEDVSRREVYDFIMDNEKKGIIPPDQTVGRVIERAWYVASSIYQGISGQEAHEKFRKGESVKQKPPLIIDGGVHLRSFELDSLDENLRARLYVDKRGMISCLIKTKKRKIKSPLKLPANEATYIRLIIDSQIIPLDGIMIHKKSGWRVRIKIG
jgi:predicted nucleotidyltransferase